jgi:sulfatase modifying factor 1
MARARSQRTAAALALAAAIMATLTLTLTVGGCANLLGIDGPHVIDAGPGDGAPGDDAEDDTTTSGDAEDGGTRSDATRDDAGDARPMDSGKGIGGDAETVAPSCAVGGPGQSDCGPQGNEPCCASPLVTGGAFLRSYDAVNYTDPSFPATVSNFRLDRFEVTVGRFRVFVSALASGWVPAPAAGKHAYLAMGGLNAGGETGWNPDDDAQLANDGGTWDARFTCGEGDATWTHAAQTTDNDAMNCVTWYEAYAFCIWDGGFLPTEAEWNYAAAGGSDQRVYPWSQPSTATAISCTNANFSPTGLPSCKSGITPVGLESPWGDGANDRWGQADLAGNAFEWGLDWFVTPYATADCVDCTEETNSGARVLRGGSYVHAQDHAMTSYRGYIDPTSRAVDVGLRCARAP